MTASREEIETIIREAVEKIIALLEEDSVPEGQKLRIEIDLPEGLRGVRTKDGIQALIPGIWRDEEGV